MLKIKKPEIIVCPDKFTIEIKPGVSVKAGEDIYISITYENGDYDVYNPLLELLSSPKEYLKAPKLFGLVVEKGKKTTFQFKAEHVGVYALRLMPFSSISTGMFLEIHSVSEEEIKQVEKIISELEKTDELKHN